MKMGLKKKSMNIKEILVMSMTIQETQIYIYTFWCLYTVSRDEIDVDLMSFIPISHTTVRITKT